MKIDRAKRWCYVSVFALLSNPCHPERSANACERAVKDPEDAGTTSAFTDLRKLIPTQQGIPDVRGDPSLRAHMRSRCVQDDKGRKVTFPSFALIRIHSRLILFALAHPPCLISLEMHVSNAQQRTLPFHTSPQQIADNMVGLNRRVTLNIPQHRCR